MREPRLALPSEEDELARVRAKFRPSERDWQRTVTELARLCGWRCYHTLRSQGSEAGFPDLVLLRQPTLLVVELKTDQGRLRPAQREWLAELDQVTSMIAEVWRPSDLDRVQQLLRREAQ
jgi:hypothetical protein